MCAKIRGVILLICLVTVSLALCVAGPVGCTASVPTAGTVYQRLQNEDPSVRIQAAVEAGKNKNSQAMPLLVDRLSDSESEVRVFAGLALKKIAGEELFRKMGWRSYDPPDQRAEAIERWREWLKKNHKKPRSRSAARQPS